MIRSICWLIALPLLGTSAWSEETTMPDLVTGEMIYDLSLDPEGDNGALVGLEGEYFFSLQKLCDAYETVAEMRIDLLGPGGEILPVETRSRHVESVSRFEFHIKTEMAGVLIEEAKGTAIREGGAIVLELEGPRPGSFTIEGDVLFPMELALAAIGEAQKGDTFAGYDVFMGAGDGTEVWFASVLIGAAKPVAGDEESVFAAAMDFDQIERWPMTFAYFPQGATEDGPPMFSVKATVYENGFMQAGVYDFRDFAMRMDLTAFKPLEPVPCS